jgi:outer membrane receptor protein involved in Fe transport
MNNFYFFNINRLVAAVCLVFLVSMLTLAQTSRGIVSGVIKDQSGAVIPGAEITLTNTDTTVARTAVTNDEGFYRFDAVDLGNYSVRVAATGFGPATKTGIVVNANQTSAVDADLAPGTQEVVVEVTADAGGQLQTEAPVRGGNISTRQITELPIAANPTALALTLPGVVTNRTGVGVGTFSINGARGRSNNFLIDGTENNDISVAGQGFQITNRDAVQEVSVQTSNFDSEFGRAGGGVINVITRSGTSDFHGTAAFLYDSSTDDAITSSQARNPRVLALGRPLFNDQKVYSATFGGPLFLPNFGEGGPVFNTERDKNFFFVAYLEDRFRAPGNSVTLVTPTAAGRAVLQQFAGTNPRVREYLALTANTIAPVANRPSQSLDPLNSTTPVRGSVAIGDFFRTFSNTSTTKQFQIRTDHKLTKNDQISFRYLQDNTASPLATINFPGFDSDQANLYRNFLITETHIFSNTTTNELRLAYNRIKLSFPLADPSGPSSTQATIAVGGLTSVGVPTNIPQGRTADNYQVQDTVTHIFGNHTIRTGVDYLRQISTQLAPADIRGSLTYAATTNFTSLANFVDDFGGANGSVNRVFGDPVYNPTLHRIAVFAQDRWKATNDLTLSAGVRYENFGTPFNTLRTPAFTGLFNVNPATRTGTFTQPNQVARDNNNFAPSVGFAYSPSFTDGVGGFIFGEKKSVIRAGYNIGYDSFFNNIASNAAASSPNQNAISVTSLATTADPRGLGNFSSLFPTTAPALVLPTSAQTLIDPNLKNPYYQRFSLGFQRELPFNIVMDVSYVGSKGTNLYINEDGNPLVRPELRNPQAVPAGYPVCTIGTFLTPANAISPLFPVGSVCPITGRLDNLQGARTVRTNGGDSNYHSGQLEVRRRFASNFTITGSYTFSKLINNADEVFAVGLGSTNGSLSAIPAIFGGQANDRGLSVDDRTHRAAFTYVIESPFFKDQQGVLGRILGGFQISGVTTFESGVPFTVTNGFDADGVGGAGDRPTFNPNGQRGVRAVPVVNAQGFITGYINPEIVLTRNAAGQPLTYAPIDPNTAQFIVNPTYVPGLAGSVIRIGNLGRNTERTPSVYNTNLTLLKRVRVSESIFIEGRVELFNAFNQPNFPGTGLIASGANALTQGLFLNPDTPSTSGGGRVTRYQVKFVF